MPDNLEAILCGELGPRLNDFLASRRSTAVIIAPQRVRDRIRAENPQWPTRWALRVDDAFSMSPPVTGFYVLAEDAGDEKAALERCRQAAPNTRALGLFRHLIPALASHGDPLDWEQRPPPRERYAIISIPRTGSTYLCAVLANLGVGCPLEYLREPTARAIARAGLSFAEWLDAAERLGAANGIFGIKLISHFLVTASANRRARMQEFVAELAHRGYHFFYLQRDFMDCVVSAAAATAAGQWHAYSHSDRAAIQDALRAPMLSDDVMLDLFCRTAADHAISETLLQDYAPITISYDRVAGAVEGVVALIRTNLGAGELQAPARQLKLPEMVHDRIASYSEIEAALREVLRRRAEVIGKRILGSLRGMSGLGDAEARIVFGTSVRRLETQLNIKLPFGS